MKYFLLLLSVMVGFGTEAPTAQPSFCFRQELLESYKASRSVLLGKTIRIDGPKSPDLHAPIEEQAHTVTFKVNRSWKGVPFAAGEFSVQWLTNCYECLELPKMNEEYLVFATPSPENEGWSLVSMCNQTVRVPSDSETSEAINVQRDVLRLDGIATGILPLTKRQRF